MLALLPPHFVCSSTIKNVAHQCDNSGLNKSGTTNDDQLVAIPFSSFAKATSGNLAYWTASFRIIDEQNRLVSMSEVVSLHNLHVILTDLKILPTFTHNGIE